MTDGPARQAGNGKDGTAAGEASREAQSRTERALLDRAQQGDELAFRRLLRRYQRLIELHDARSTCRARTRTTLSRKLASDFAKAVRNGQPHQRAGFPTVAILWVSRQLAGALARARHAKHQPLTNATRGEQAERAWSTLQEREDPYDRVAARELIEALRSGAEELSELERSALAHALAGWSSGETAGKARHPAPTRRQRPTARKTQGLKQLLARAA